jgi:hypothetical protein
MLNGALLAEARGVPESAIHLLWSSQRPFIGGCHLSGAHHWLCRSYWFWLSCRIPFALFGSATTPGDVVHFVVLKFPLAAFSWGDMIRASRGLV